VRARLQKLLAEAGLASRRGAEDWIRAGRVTVNGRPVRLGDSADPARDRIAVDGRPLRLEAKAYWVLHKPRGVVTTRSDPAGRRTVLELLPSAARRLRLYPVGRLDLDSEGLVLLTNDGALAQRLLHPSFESEKEYVVEARGAPSDEALARLAAGFALARGERPTAPARVTRAGRVAGRGSASERTCLRVVLREGRKRQLRRAFEALGHPLERLVRVRIGPLRLHDLAPGVARALTTGERRALERHAASLAPSGKRQLAPEAGAAASETARARKARPARSPRHESR
jgi:23S rRNA pseudouridine2605 synthase